MNSRQGQQTWTERNFEPTLFHLFSRPVNGYDLVSAAMASFLGFILVCILLAA